MDPPATVPGSSRPLVASESESSIASQLLPLDEGDSDMASLATVSEPAIQQDSQNESAEEDLVSQFLVDNDSEMVDADFQVGPAMEEQPKSTNPHETPLTHSNQDDTAEHARISTSEGTVQSTATNLSSLEIHDLAAAESNNIPLQNTTTSTETPLEVGIDASNPNYGAISKDAHVENAGVPKHNQAPEEDEDDDGEGEDDDDDDDMLSELSEGGDLQVYFYIL